MSNVKNEVFVLKIALSAFDYIFIIVLSTSTDVMKSSKKILNNLPSLFFKEIICLRV